jgi:hypothetical protein
MSAVAAEVDEPSIPSSTASRFPPGTPISEVRAVRDREFQLTRERLARMKTMTLELVGSGEFEAAPEAQHGPR